mmetsp:Transcript_26952/g.84638  ORF Transcript_26952/g.84638 Transcript_26952/m.84638 type:complete len:222 (+) Transcript_26952:727-1392(+)
MGTTTVKSSLRGMKMAPNQQAMSTRHTNTQPTKATGKRTDVTSIRSMRMLAGEKVMKVKPGISEPPDFHSSDSSLSDERMTFTNSNAAGLNGSMVGKSKVSMAWWPLLTSRSHSICRFFEVCDRKIFRERKFVRTKLMRSYLRHFTPFWSSPWKVALTKLLAVRLYGVSLVSWIRWSTIWQLASKKVWSRTSAGLGVVEETYGMRLEALRFSLPASETLAT